MILHCWFILHFLVKYTSGTSVTNDSEQLKLIWDWGIDKESRRHTKWDVLTHTHLNQLFSKRAIYVRAWMNNNTEYWVLLLLLTSYELILDDKKESQHRSIRHDG